MASLQAVLMSARGLYPTTTGVTPQLLNGANPDTPGNPLFIDQVTIEEKHHDEMEITQHPIAQGAPITDHAYKKPSELTLFIGWSQGGSTNGPALTPSAMNAIYASLRTGQINRVLYNVVTGKRTYVNMLIQSLSTETDKEKEFVLKISVKMKQVIIVNAQYQSLGVGTADNMGYPEQTQPIQQMGVVVPILSGAAT